MEIACGTCHISPFSICAYMKERNRNILDTTVLCPSWMPSAQSLWATDHVNLRIFCLAYCLMLVIKHCISFPVSQIKEWQAECFVANVKSQKKKELEVVCGLPTCWEGGIWFNNSFVLVLIPICRLGGKWPFVELLECLYLSLFLIGKVRLCILIVELSSGLWQDSHGIILIHKDSMEMHEMFVLGSFPPFLCFWTFLYNWKNRQIK